LFGSRVLRLQTLILLCGGAVGTKEEAGEYEQLGLDHGKTLRPLQTFLEFNGMLLLEGIETRINA
jgi:hypothetical protein